MKQALVAGKKKGYVSDGRTGKNHWIKHNYDETTLRIAQLLADEVGYPIENAEAFQVIHYDENEQYKQHFDGWLFDGSENSKRNMKYGGQRMKTCLVYLNDVQSGGGTKFTKLNLEVNSEKGKLLVFDNVHSNTNNRHELSEHAGMPVIEGEKWAFNLWFREESRCKICKYESISQLTPSDEKFTETALVHSVEDAVEETDTTNEIKTYRGVFSNKELSKLLCGNTFEDKERATAWIAKNRVPEILDKLEKLVAIDSAYFETMCVTKYAPKVVHRDHLDAYDLTTTKGMENTSKTGQRLMTITGFLSETKVLFPKLNKQYDMQKGDLLVYNNCFDNIGTRNEDMIKSYSPLGVDEVSSLLSPMILFNIYVREKSRTKLGILKIANGIIESKLAEKTHDSACNLSNEEIIQMIYTRHPLENLKILGFKITNKAPVHYVVDTISKIKQLIDKSENGFLNQLNLEIDYYIDEYNPVTIEDVLSTEVHKIVDEYFKTNIKNGVYLFGDRQSKRYKTTDEIMTRLLHLELLPLIEKIVGRKMEATYTYISAYVKGADLPAHTDRPECEFTCSYIIGKPPDTNWNIYIHKSKQPVKYKGRYDFTPPKEECIAVDCRENGLMIFNGTDHIHYREPLEHEYYNVVLLHYKTRQVSA
tara:strand:- start:434 stop:2377 length:1944 start_codon:yes stop_codon:yes gene_type:complete